MKQERFEFVDGFSNYYKIGDFGTIVSLRMGFCIMKPQIDKSGYLVINLMTKERKIKNVKIHRLVANAFIPNTQNYPQVNHIDGNKKNNHYTNLEWCTAEYNREHAIKNGLYNVNGEKNGMAKLTDIQRKEIVQKRLEGFTLKQLADKYGVKFGTISNITINAGFKITNHRHYRKVIQID